jgi:hypothetical protein
MRKRFDEEQAMLSGTDAKRYNDLRCRLSMEAATVCDEASACG